MTDRPVVDRPARLRLVDPPAAGRPDAVRLDRSGFARRSGIALAEAVALACFSWIHPLARGTMRLLAHAGRAVRDKAQ